IGRTGRLINDCSLEEYDCLHDVRQLADSKANNGYFLTHDWPLWPKKDSDQYRDFINYKQVVVLPVYLRILNVVSAACWILFLIFFFIVSLKSISKKVFKLRAD